MNLTIENTTRFFTVVGAPYIAEHHFAGCDEDADIKQHAETCAHLPGEPAGWWLQD